MHGTACSALRAGTLRQTALHASSARSALRRLSQGAVRVSIALLVNSPMKQVQLRVLRVKKGITVFPGARSAPSALPDS